MGLLSYGNNSSVLTFQSSSGWRGEILSFLLQLQGLSLPYSTSSKHPQKSYWREKEQKNSAALSNNFRMAHWMVLRGSSLLYLKKKQMWLQLCQLPQLRKMSLLLTFMACSSKSALFFFFPFSLAIYTLCEVPTPFPWLNHILMSGWISLHLR